MAGCAPARANINCDRIYNDINPMLDTLIALRGQVVLGSVAAMKCSAIQRSEQILKNMTQTYRSCKMEAEAIRTETNLDQMQNEREFLYSQVGIICPTEEGNSSPPIVFDKQQPGR
jgi:hypothetical protein